MSTINTNFSNSPNIDSLRQEALDLIKKMHNMAKLPTEESSPTPPDNPFAQLLSATVSQVNELQNKAETMKAAYETGDTQVNLAQLALASQEASIGFQFLVSLRNKAIDAYKDVMNMPI